MGLIILREPHKFASNNNPVNDNQIERDVYVHQPFQAAKIPEFGIRLSEVGE